MTTLSPVDICNLALDMIGVAQPIQDLDDSGEVPELCKRHYAFTRDTLLDSFPWPFLTKRQILGLVEDIDGGEHPDREWDFSYRWPAGLVTARRIVNTVLPESFQYPFRIGQDSDGILIFTDVEDAIIEGVFSRDETGDWPQLFTDCLVAKLAKKIAPPLRVEPAMMARADAEYGEALMRAQGRSNADGVRHQSPPSRYEQARGSISSLNMSQSGWWPV